MVVHETILFYSLTYYSRSKGPCNDIDVYLQSLVDELKQLCDGNDTHDSHSGETFRLKGALL